ncbi:MAG: nucleotidyltransferase domain-containing protein [Elusimicrobia bacterium]|nr:nucleotidyltransferase domain-containing protein [Elusimicrobiota bacterium]
MQEIKNVLEAWKKAFAKELVAVVLFGSRARGDYDSHSDWDLFVVFTNPPQNPWERVRMLRMAMPAGHPPLNLLVHSPREIDRDISPLFLDVVLDGRVLYDPENFFKERKTKALRIIQGAGLERRRVKNEFFWQWKAPPSGRWELTWNGFCEFP